LGPSCDPKKMRGRVASTRVDRRQNSLPKLLVGFSPGELYDFGAERRYGFAKVCEDLGTKTLGLAEGVWGVLQR
jgi:hypothetical protein